MAAAAAKQNEPTQAGIDTVSIHLVRLAIKAKDAKLGDLRAAYNTAELRGLDKEAAKEAIKLFDEGADAVDAYFKQFKTVGHYLTLLGRTFSPQQYELFGEKRGPAPEDERARNEGRAAGLDVDPEVDESKNPYEIGSLKGQAWLSAFRDGRSERDLVLSMPKPDMPEGGDKQGDDGKKTDDEGEA